MRDALVRITQAILVVTAAILILVAPVAAGEPVDPNTLNPPPPDFFNSTCERIGRGIQCNLAFSDPPYAGRVIVDEATGELIASHGPHRLDDYFVRGDLDAIRPICEALA